MPERTNQMCAAGIGRSTLAPATGCRTGAVRCVMCGWVVCEWCGVEVAVH